VPFVEESKSCKQGLKDLKKGVNARKKKVKVGWKTVTAKAKPTKAEQELQKNPTFQMEMLEDHQQNSQAEKVRRRLCSNCF
jgi:hypothetical protein